MKLTTAAVFFFCGLKKIPKGLNSNVIYDATGHGATKQSSDASVGYTIM